MQKADPLSPAAPIILVSSERFRMVVKPAPALMSHPRYPYTIHIEETKFQDAMGQPIWTLIKSYTYGEGGIADVMFDIAETLDFLLKQYLGPDYKET